MAVEMSWRRPADYYSSGAPERVLPQWAPYGCGGAALLVLILVFAGGAFLSRGGLFQLMDFVFGTTMGEIRGMYAKDVTKEQKDELEKEIAAMRKELRAKSIRVERVSPLLETIRKVTADEKITRAEMDMILAAVKKVNKSSSRRVVKSTSGVSRRLTT